MSYFLKRDFPKLHDFQFPRLKTLEMGETWPHVQPLEKTPPVLDMLTMVHQYGFAFESLVEALWH